MWIKATRKIIDKKYISPSLKSSLQEVGKTVAGVPQLGITSSVSSAFIALAISKIVAGKKVKSGRHIIDTNVWKA